MAQRFLEAITLIALTAIMLRPARTRLRALTASVPWRYVARSLTGLALLLGGHAISHGEATYPLDAWDMYTENNPADPELVDYVAVTTTGREERLLLGRLFPAGGRHFRERIDSAALAVSSSNRGSEAIEQLDAMLGAIVEAHERLNPPDTVSAIRLFVRKVPARAYGGPSSIERRQIHEYLTR
jgi:hypothetical protein